MLLKNAVQPGGELCGFVDISNTLSWTRKELEMNLKNVVEVEQRFDEI